MKNTDKNAAGVYLTFQIAEPIESTAYGTVTIKNEDDSYKQTTDKYKL